MDGICIRFYEFGKPSDVLKVERRTIERLLDHEVLVRMSARPINPSDLIPIRGSYSHRISLPNIPGYEGVGIVEAVGTKVSNHLIGKRVLPLRGEGTWQDLVKTEVDYTVIVPDSIDDFTAAQLYINPMTAWVTCTEILRLRQNDVLIVNACGSAIGHIYAQLAKIFGFRLIAVTRNHHYTKDLLELGASHVINTSETNLYEAVMELTNGRGGKAAIDSIGGPDGTELAFCLEPNGYFLTIGLLSGKQVNWAEIDRQGQVNASLFHLRHWNNKVTSEIWQETFKHILSLINERKLSLMPINSTYNLMNIKEALKVVELSQKTNGKVFLTNP
ncbi:zinc-dependent alcohol dehydrogenase family protein [Anaerobacillus sp. MEB173]|uniref:zinc-dependent alcohol dehydrogenase family protein n=1 Tax=Anaerobacillus sp. MEB173 TaxID=3383345 RepID=UPI003F9329C3